MRKPGAIERVVEARPDVFNHNLETVQRLYPAIRPGSRYFTSLELLHRVKRLDPAMFTKSGVKIGRAHVRTPVANAHLVCRLRLAKKKTQKSRYGACVHRSMRTFC